MKKNLLKSLLVATALLTGSMNTLADEIQATLVHTASSFCGDNASVYTSTVDAVAEHVNNAAFNDKWQGAAYADFTFSLPEGTSITSAILTYKVIGESRRDRAANLQYVDAGEQLNYDELLTGTSKVNLAATTIQSITFPKGSEATLKTDVTVAVKTIAEAGQGNIIFKWTGNPGGGDVAGKTSDDAPTLVITTASADTQTTYTVKYTDGQNELKDAKVYDGTIGETATASAEDMASFVANEKKWSYKSGNETITLVKKPASNVITLVFEELPVYSYTVVSSLGTTIGSGQNFKGETVSVPYGKYIVSDGILYTKDATDKQFNYSFTLQQDNQTETLDYTKIEDITPIFFTEAEDVEGLTPETGGNANIRCSMSKGAYNAGEEPVVVTKLQPGSYKVEFQVWGNAGATLTLACGNFNYSLDTAGYIVTGNSDAFTLTEATDLTITGGVAGGKCADYILVYQDESTTGIKTLTSNSAATQVFNLQGQRVQQAVKGLYIVNGKKVIVK